MVLRKKRRTKKIRKRKNERVTLTNEIDDAVVMRQLQTPWLIVSPHKVKNETVSRTIRKVMWTRWQQLDLEVHLTTTQIVEFSLRMRIHQQCELCLYWKSNLLRLIRLLHLRDPDDRWRVLVTQLIIWLITKVEVELRHRSHQLH